MGCRELIESLRAAGEGRVRALRAEAEQETAHIRAEAEKRIEALRNQQAHRQAEAAAERASRILAEANGEARLVRLRSERALAERLHARALASLPAVRNVGYEDVFISFVRELPSFAWRSIQVHPDDVVLARGHYPGAEVTAAPGITGGFIAVSEEDQVRVVNTFEQRLENLWEELLPDLMREAADLAR
jgi:vacuolar-type H+-ATPase subunit E/Vma4